MKVKELIRDLSNFLPESEVVVESCHARSVGEHHWLGWQIIGPVQCVTRTASDEVRLTVFGKLKGTEMPDKEALCENCHHAYKYHFNALGDRLPCDAEVRIGADACFESTVVLCGCPQFVLATA